MNVELAPEAADVRRLLEELPRRRREMVVARFYLGLDVDVIAGEQRCSEEFVEAVIDDARARLVRIARAAWERHADHERG